MKRWSKKEPARQLDYRRVYRRIKSWQEGVEDRIDYLYTLISQQRRLRMAAVPITFSGIMYPKDKSTKPYPFTALGFASITGLEVGGGPIIPPDELPDLPKPPGDLIIWGGPFDPPHPAHPIVLPDPILPPVNPPVPPPPPHEGWNWSAAKGGWYYLYVPGEGEATPKRPR